MYETSKIFVFPSEAENFPIVLLEAIASGLAIITTQGTGFSEVVGDAALLVKARNPTEIRLSPETLNASPDLISELGAVVRKRLAEKFGWPRVAAEYARLYGKDCRVHR